VTEELLLIRHGESQHLVEDITGGWTDTHLTERGIAQANAVADQLQVLLRGQKFSLFSSDLHRASKTAEIIASRFNHKIIYLKSLRELDNGVGANLSNDDARKIMNPPTQPLEEWIPFDGAESWNMLYDRVTEALCQISTIEKRRAVIISHGNTLRCLISSWLGILLERGIRYDLHTCSITWLRVNRLGQRTIRKLNECGHLAILGLESIEEYH
jgi:probable phosphoglycerate mutase